MKSNDIVSEMSRSQELEQAIRAKDEQIENLRKELHEYIMAEEVLIAARLVAKCKVDQAHEIVRTLHNA